jgi:hypothetical protein
MLDVVLTFGEQETRLPAMAIRKTILFTCIVLLKMKWQKYNNYFKFKNKSFESKYENASIAVGFSQRTKSCFETLSFWL